MPGISIYSPTGMSNAEAGVTTLAPSLSLDGRKIAALDNGKAGADHLLTAMGTRLAKQTGAEFIGLRRKGTAATPCEAALLERLIAEADVVLTGTAD